ncbi:MAG: hypothetical protein J5594_00705 [Elusimicrobiaceae bacterium]|nr:hypothetical protein [Elusimicrobiaceae bacterium]
MKKYSVYLWGIVALIFTVFIGIMSFWYPVTLDEFFRWQEPFTWGIIKDAFKEAYFVTVPRASVFFGISIFGLGKWSFILLNPLVQLSNCLCIFYILFVRFPNVKDLTDMPYFIIILFMSVFFVCTPSQVMFWLSGAINYTWTILPFLIMLCLLRRIQTKNVILKDSLTLRIFLFILGFLVGTSNECLAPVAFGLALCFALFYEYKKVKTPRALSFLIFGLAIGCLVFFSAPIHYNKMTLGFISKITAASLSQKLFFHIHHLNKFFKAQFYIAFLIFIFLIIGFLDKDKRDTIKEDLWNSLFIFMISIMMAFILFAAPRTPLRAYYSASVLIIIAFLFLVKYYICAYKFDFSKWLCYIIITVGLFLSPRFILPHYSLYLQTDIHVYLENLSTPVFAPYMILRGPTPNLSIGFTDPARSIEMEEGRYYVTTSPLTNW